MFYTWIGNGYKWEFFIVSCWRAAPETRANACVWSSGPRSAAWGASAAPRAGRWRPLGALTLTLYPAHALCLPRQVPIGVSLGSIALCILVNKVLKRKPAVPGFIAAATHPDLFPAAAAPGAPRRPRAP
jgi:hypothetical protein